MKSGLEVLPRDRKRTSRPWACLSDGGSGLIGFRPLNPKA